MKSFADILNWMNQGKPFSCKVITLDQQRKKGGKILEIPQAVLVQKKDQPKEKAAMPKLKRSPNHRKYYTRNVRLITDGLLTTVINKIHIPLIIEFNGEMVTP